MDLIGYYFISLCVFMLITFSSHQVGRIFSAFHLPLITGFIFTGIIAGPYVFNLVPKSSLDALSFIDEFALAFIAFAAGSELYLEELKDRLKSIKWVSVFLVTSTFLIGVITILTISEYIPFMSSMSSAGVTAVALLTGAILVARSPSSALAVIKELRAKGPFTKTALGVTVVIDVLVIILFAINSAIADALLTEISFNFYFILLLIFEIGFAFVLGYILSALLRVVLFLNVLPQIKIVTILLLGFGTFMFSSSIRHYSGQLFPFEFLFEPLLICMFASFLVSNYSVHRDEFLRLLHITSMPVYIAFFTFTGVGLTLDILTGVWAVALILFGTRLVALFIGSFIGGTIAGDPVKHNNIAWMSYVTQAGVGLGLAKEVAVEFPTWGNSFATMIIAVIILNQLVGPILFKWAIFIVKESHIRAKATKYFGRRDCIIFGCSGQSIALAVQLLSHHWEVKVLSERIEESKKVTDSNVDVVPIPAVNKKEFSRLGISKINTVVLMLDDTKNFEMAEFIFETFGTRNLVVFLNDRANYDKFKELKALIVTPSTAIISLLDHFVRAPATASLLLGMEANKDIIDLEVKNSNFFDVKLKHLRFPIDTMVLSVRRGREMLMVHDDLRLRQHDYVTIAGISESLDDISLSLEGE